MLNPDFRDMLSALSAARADYLVVGAYALAAHGFPRATGDMDLWIRPTKENALRVWQALAAFGAPTSKITVDDFSTPDIVYQIGIAPRRIDILTSISGVDFHQAWKDRISVEIDGLTVPVIGREHLLANKRASGRPRDLTDAEMLEQHDS
ncbi:MAG: hypothetical protein JW829_12970 [Pirellulales bacterium]|nr:hypothetical protein [Pirellulales bacterium]